MASETVLVEPNSGLLSALTPALAMSVWEAKARAVVAGH
jgi:hypothetical protein